MHGRVGWRGHRRTKLPVVCACLVPLLPSPYHSVIGIARAPSWKGPYTVDPAPIVPQFFEDPFLWYQPETDSYHALFHTMGGCSGVGCHAFSPDGYHWNASSTPAYGCVGCGSVRTGMDRWGEGEGR